MTPGDSQRGAGPSSENHRTLRAMGVTMLGVIVSVGVTVGFGVRGPWWLQLGAALASMVTLVVGVKTGTKQGARGPVSRAASWIAGGDEQT